MVSRGLKIILVITIVLVGKQLCFASEVISYEDPWESFNRKMFVVNEKLDEWVLRPVSNGYDKVTPKPVQGLVTQFFSNIGEIRNIANSIFQIKLKDAAISSARFLINSTIGMVGMLDVASEIGLPKKYEDFGLTLARWHVPSGPYVVWPILGPNTVRSTVGWFPDNKLDITKNLDESSDQYAFIYALRIVNGRNNFKEMESLVIGDKYTFIKGAYLQSREYLITGKPPADDF